MGFNGRLFSGIGQKIYLDVIALCEVCIQGNIGSVLFYKTSKRKQIKLNKSQENKTKQNIIDSCFLIKICGTIYDISQPILSGKPGRQP